MLVAALIVLILATLLLLAALFGGNSNAYLDLGLFDIDATSSVVFFLGMVTLLLFVIGIGMLRLGMKRASAHRKDRKKVSELSQKLDQFKTEQHREQDSHDDKRA